MVRVARKEMRVLVFSDLHGDASLIAEARQRSKDCDLVICCGDITPVHGSTIDAGRKIGRLGAGVVLAVPGNFELPNDLRETCRELGWTDIHGKSFEVGGITFAGCGGGNHGPFKTPYELSEQQFSDILGKLETTMTTASQKRSVLVTHCPPFGAVDEPREGLHVGSRNVREFVERSRPIMHFCGHIHECGGRTESLGETKITNVARQIRLVDLR